MSDRALKKLFVVLITLVAFYGVSTLFGGWGDGTQGDGDGTLAALFDSVVVEDITAVTFATPETDGPVRLERAGVDWSANGRPADSGAVARFLTALDAGSLGDLVSRNEANHERMGVSSDLAAQLVLERGGRADTVLLGSAAASFGSVFVRRPSEDDVFVLDADVRSAAVRTSDQWRSKRILALDTASVTAVAVTLEEDAYELSRSDAGWALAGSPADSATVRFLLGELVNLLASDFADPELTGYDEPLRTVVIHGGEEAPIATVRLWSPPEETAGVYHVTAEGRVAEPGVVYQMPTWRADRLAPARDRIVGSPGSG